MTIPKLQERDLAAPVRARLRSLGYKVSEEVTFLGKIADFIGSDDNSDIVVEMKTQVTLDLLAQVEFWKEHTTKRWIAVPVEKGEPTRARLAGYRICREWGIGCLVVNSLDKREQERFNRGEDMSAGLLDRVTVIVEAASDHNVDTRPLASTLTARHQVEQAGSKLCVRVNRTQTAHQEIRDYLDAMGGSATVERTTKHVGISVRLALGWATEASIVGVQLDMREVDIMLRRVPVGDEVPVYAGTSKSNPRRRVA